MLNRNFIGVIILFLACFFSSPAKSQLRVLHYTETSGFDHNTRLVSQQMFSQLANELGFILDNDDTGTQFNSSAILNQYNVVIFSNTTGDAILDSIQRANFENYISLGGNAIGIHSATDTYRHSSANGSNTGSWDFFPEMLGASVQQNPSHVNGTPVYLMQQIQAHPLLNDIPLVWNKAEEYYYWENGYFDLTNNVLLEVGQTIGPNGLTNSYDSARATTWYKSPPNGSRIFYTSLGHDPSNFTSDTLFYKLLRNALQWTMQLTSIEELNGSYVLNVYPNPFSNFVNIESNEPCRVEIVSVSGNRVLMNADWTRYRQLKTTNLPAGAYFVRAIFDKKVITKLVSKPTIIQE